MPPIEPLMDLVTFIAESAADAVTQVRARLGPNAVVVNVRPIPPSPSLWFRRRKPRFEILAYRGDGPPPPAGAPPPAVPSSPVGTGVSEVSLSDTATEVELWGALAASPEDRPTMAVCADPPPPPARSGGGTWRVGALLEASGLLPHLAQRVVDQLQRDHGAAPPGGLAEELDRAREVLTRLWEAIPRPPAAPGTHVFLGAPGVGKTTCLCKWLTQAVLVEGRPARVWRIDGQTANTSEALAVYCDVLGVPTERVWRAPGPGEEGEYRFIDLPGTDWRRGEALSELRRQVDRLAPAGLHLVLNAAYDLPILLRQVRAFSGFSVADLIVTHLDEETRWGKLWNLVLGTNCPLRFLSAGQNIPGDFLPASPEAILRRQFRA